MHVFLEEIAVCSHPQVGVVMDFPNIKNDLDKRP